jgi:glycosyltransferase involved in cell wall biosynthesis
LIDVIKILHLLNDVREIGTGIVNVAVDLACLQAKLGYQVSVASAGGDYEALLAQYGVQHFYLEQRRKPLPLLRSMLRYRSLIQGLQPDIVHAHMMTGVLLARCLRGTHPYAVVSTVHNEFLRSAVLMGLADRVIAVSQAVAESMTQRGISPAKLRVVRNGTIGSPRLVTARTEIAAPLHRPAITSVAGMTDRKGIGELIQAFVRIAPQFPDAHLYLVGYGPDWEKFKQQGAETPVSDRIHFEGFQPNPFRYLQATDVFVLASRREPFGLVLAEAREAGCAIVASDVDGIPEALDQGRAGILVPPADEVAIATALTDLLANPALREHWSQQAQQNLEWLSVTRMTQETLAVYHELLTR